MNCLGAISSGVLKTQQIRFVHIDKEIKVKDDEDSIFVTSRDSVKHRRIEEEIGFVSAGVVQSRSILHDVASAIKGFFGGESHHYSDLLDQASRDAVIKMARMAKAEGATAVVRLRLNHQAVMNRLVFGLHVSVLAYGTAVICESVKPTVKQSLSPLEEIQGSIRTTK
eukprot:CAMPEP_0113934006 /NCGR_PEP_ID=MMETSP1339-20121228/1350_1 /TAXON_ID=94617 /ORGANISM="Fibrocapsa japonica" /LENGTH=167 /DNA_ID=CAMNT_0000935607 /DNA_START=102 /DNA_END=605 /DNA_ORIENTATION=- /assembly_acc=CAM_ASM_000762